MAKTKILILIDSLTCGGAEKSLISLLPFLAERDYDITLMVIKPGGLFERYVPGNVKLMTFPYQLPLMRRLAFSLALRLIQKGRKAHGAEMYWQYAGRYLPELKEEYDVAIAYQQGFPTFYIAEKVRAKRKLCWINVDMKSAGYSPAFCKPFYEKYDHIAAVSETLKNDIVIPLFCKDRNRVFTCLDILNEPLIRKMSDEFVSYQNKRKWNIVTVGRLVELKGYDMAIGAAKHLKAKGIDFMWHFVGGGILFNRLQDSIDQNGLHDYVILEGEQLNPYPFIKAADIYVQTSRFEGFGLTIGEAKILGRPIVSTNFPVVYNQITNGENGLVVGMSPEDIAGGILHLISDEALRQKLMASVAAEHNATAETESAKVIKLIEEEH